MLKWLDSEAVLHAVRSWAEQTASQHPELLRIGLFGSYARGDWGVGSDIDLVVIVRQAETPFIERGRAYNIDALPLSTDLLVYTEAEWQKLLAEGRFAPRIEREAIWVYP